MPTGLHRPSPPAGAVSNQLAAASAKVSSLPPFTVLARQRKKLVSKEGVSGAAVASVSLDPPPSSQAYLVEVIHVSSTSTSPSVASVQVDGDEIDFSTNANQDVANENPPIWVGAGSVLSVDWSNLSTAAAVTALVQYLVVSGP